MNQPYEYMGPWFIPKFLLIQSRFRREIHIRKLFRDVWYPADLTKNEAWELFKHGSCMLWVVQLFMKTILKSVPTGKLSKLFDIIHRVSFSAESNTPLDKFLLRLVPRNTVSNSNILSNLQPNFNKLGNDSGSTWDWFMKKNQRPKCCATVPLKEHAVIWSFNFFSLIKPSSVNKIFSILVLDSLSLSNF